MEMKERAGNDLVKRIFYAMLYAQCIKNMAFILSKTSNMQNSLCKKVQIVKIFTKGRVVW